MKIGDKTQDIHGRKENILTLSHDVLVNKSKAKFRKLKVHRGCENTKTKHQEINELLLGYRERLFKGGIGVETAMSGADSLSENSKIGMRFIHLLVHPMTYTKSVVN